MLFTCEHCKNYISVDQKESITSVIRCNYCKKMQRIPEDICSPGCVIAGAVIEEEIGYGGEGRIFRAWHPALECTVALKVLTPDALHINDFKRIIEIHDTGKSFTHPNLVRIYSVGEEDDLYYILMEHLSGANLGDIIRNNIRLGMERSLEICEAIGSALSYLWNEFQIIHCDIKPENIMLTDDDTIKLIDFGLATHIDKNTPMEEEVVMGTCEYISPEQLLGRSLDIRSDLYCLGGTMYQLLTGRPPYGKVKNNNHNSLSLQHLVEPLTPPLYFLPDCNPPVSRLVEGMMTKYSNLRYSSFEELQQDINLVKNGDMPQFPLNQDSQKPFNIGDIEGKLMTESLSKELEIWRREKEDEEEPATLPILEETKEKSVFSFTKNLFKFFHKVEEEEKELLPWWNHKQKNYKKHDVFESISSQKIFMRLAEMLEQDKVPVISIPEKTQKILDLLNKKEFAYGKIISLITETPHLAGEILKLANSIEFYRGVPVSDLRTAIIRIGAVRLKALLHLDIIHRELDKTPVLKGLATDIIEHCRYVSTIASYLSNYFCANPDEVYTAAALHDIGKLAILKVLTEYVDFEEIDDIYINEGLFDEIIPSMHETAGALLANHWQLEPVICRAITHHHSYYLLDDSEEVVKQTAALVNLSDTSARLLGYGPPLYGINLFDLQICKYFNLNEEDPNTVEIFRNIPRLFIS